MPLHYFREVNLGSRNSNLVALSRSELVLLFLLATVQFTHIMDFMIVMPLGPQLMRLFSISPQQFGFLVSTYQFAAGATSFLAAFVIDRFDRKRVLLGSYFGFALGTLACAWAPNYLFLMVARSIAGAFGGVLGAVIFSIIGDAIHESKRGRAMGIVMAAFSLASVFGVPFGLYLATRLNWHAPFVFVGGVALIAIGFLFAFMPAMTGHFVRGVKAAGPTVILQRIASDRNQVRALTFTVVLMMSQFMVIPFLSPSMVSNVGFAESDLPYIYLVGGGLTIFTSPLVGRMADRFGKARIYAIGSFLVLIPIAIVTNLGPSPVPWVLVATSMYFVAGNARFIPSSAMVTSSVRASSRGSFMSINSSFQSLAAGFASMIAGLIVTLGADGRLVNYEIVGYLSMALVLLGVWISRGIKAVE